MPRCTFYILFAAIVWAPGNCDAARLLVHTTARSASGHVAGTHHQIVLTDTGHVVAGPVSLRDTARVTRTVVDPSGSVAFFGARRTDLHRIDSALDSPLFIVGMQMAPLRALPRPPVFPLYFRSPEAPTGPPASSGPPREFTIDSASDPSRGLTARLLTAGAKTIVELQSQGPPLRYELPTLERQYAVRPVAIALTGDGYAVVLTTGRDLDSSTNEPVSWLHTLALEDLRPLGKPLAIPGSAESTHGPLQIGQDGACWVATYSPGASFAYVNQIELAEEGAELRRQMSYSGVSNPPLIALLPGRDDVIVALGRRIERQQHSVSRSFDATISALVRAGGELFVGEGGRVHALDPETFETRRTIQLQTGIVDEIVVLPEPSTPDSDGDGIPDESERRRGTSPDHSDSDGDEIPDGVDPEPNRPSPRLQLPDLMVFYADAAGTQARVFALDAPGETDPAWSIEIDDAAAPWLLATRAALPRTPDRILTAVDPVQLPAHGDAPLRGVLTVHQQGARPGRVAAGSPATVSIFVVPRRAQIPKVLLAIEDAGGSQARNLGAYSEFARLLAAPPHHFSVVHAREAVQGPLEQYALVVLTAQAAARGTVTRQALLDYVAAGGSLLLLAGYDPQSEADDAIARWLDPLGFHVDRSSRAAPGPVSVRAHPLTRYWREAPWREACFATVGPNARNLAYPKDQPDHTLFAVRLYGLGRTALLASTEPVENAALQSTSGHRFTSDLIRWLARARAEIRDRDGDLLADYIEDRNRNGRVDAGETDGLNPDTDGDGLSDGLEDENRNGRVDANETNPLAADSDDDGIMDAADASPLPALGDPWITSVDPETGPAEGGSSIVVLGGNFVPRSEVWFGDTRSENVRSLDTTRLLATLPPTRDTDGAAIDVRVRDPETSASAQLPAAFRYTRASFAGLSLEHIRTVETQYNVYEGELQLKLELPGIRIASLDVLLSVVPENRLSSFQLLPGPRLKDAQRTIEATHVAPGYYRVRMRDGRPVRTDEALAIIRWRASRPGAHEVPFAFRLQNPALRVHLGGALVPETSGIEFTFAPSGVETEPRSQPE